MGCSPWGRKKSDTTATAKHTTAKHVAYRMAGSDLVVPIGGMSITAAVLFVLARTQVF